MYFLRPSAILIIIIASALLPACEGPSGSANTPGTNVNTQNGAVAQNKANTNAEELGMLINFAWETEDLAWKKDDTKKTLTAVFRLSPEDAKKLAEQLTARSPGAPTEVQIEDWFPAELVAQGESAGGSSVEGTAFQATDLYQAPYDQGTISRIVSTDFFVIELHSKQ